MDNYNGPEVVHPSTDFRSRRARQFDEPDSANTSVDGALYPLSVLFMKKGPEF
jgi:hypothetical protein